MTGLLLLPHDAPRAEWLEARRAGITASEIAVILGISPFDSPFNLHFRKLGLIQGQAENTAMSLGTHLEPWIADQWAADHRDDFHVLSAGLFVNTDRPWQMATPDRLLYSTLLGVSEEPVSQLEIKSSGTYDGWGPDGSDIIPAYYRAQVLWQLDTLDLKLAHVTCFFLHTRSRRDYVVHYYETDVALMRTAAEDFRARLATAAPPPVDGHTATLTALKQLHPLLDEDAEVTVTADLAAEWRDACRQLRLSKTTKRHLESRMRQAMGTAKYAVDDDGRKVATRSRYEMGARAMPPCTVDKLTPARPKKDTP